MLFRSLAVKYCGAGCFKLFCQWGALIVGSGDRKAFFKKDLGQAAHADAADSDKMYVYGFFEIYFIHKHLPVPYNGISAKNLYTFTVNIILQYII